MYSEIPCCQKGSVQTQNILKLERKLKKYSSMFPGETLKGKFLLWI